MITLVLLTDFVDMRVLAAMFIGHNWKVKFTFQTDRLDSLGMV
jgi:hypothetical protein